MCALGIIITVTFENLAKCPVECDIRKSRKSRDSLEDEGEGGEDGGDGEEGVGVEGWEGGEGRKRRRKKRGRQKRSIEECPPTLTAVTPVAVEEEDFAPDPVEEEENFPRYEVVEGVPDDTESLEHQDKSQGGTAIQPGSEGNNVDGATAGGVVEAEEEEEGVLIEVGERVKLKRRRKRRHSRGGEEEEGEGEGGNGGDTSCEDHLGSLRRAAKHKKRKHGHGEGHSNRRKHHDVRKVPVDGVLPEQPPDSGTPLPNLENVPPEPSEGSPHESQANTASAPSLPSSTPLQAQSSLPAGANPAVGAVGKAQADTKQRVAIRITLCGECDSRHVLDACPLKRPLTIIHDTVVLRETTEDEELKDDEPGAERIPFGDNESKEFANEEEEEGEADDTQDAQDASCRKKKKKSGEDNEDALISSGGKEQEDRRRRRNGFSEALEDRLSVPNGKYQQNSGDRSQVVVMAAQDEVKQVNGDNSDASVTDSKDVKEESSIGLENKLDAHEEDMLSNGDANLVPAASLSPKPLIVNDLESATDTLASHPSPIPMPDPISASDATVGGGNNNNGKSFAEASLPMALKLETREASHGPGVTAKRPIARFTQFGPLLGRKIREMDIPDDFGMRHIWEVMGASGRFLLSTEDPTTSNWLRFIRPAPTREQRNVAPVTRGDRLYFVTTAPLQVGEELLYWPDESSGANAVPTSGGAASSTPNASSNPSSTSSSSSSSASSSSGTGWAKKKMEKTNCGGCNLRFGHPLYYRLHCSVFHDPNFSLTIRKYHCKVCGAAVLGKENIMRHAAENHDGKGAYQCQFCKKFFLRLNYLEMHRTYGCAANPQRTRPLCDFCGRKFCQPQKLKVHIKRMHSDMADVLREFQCKLCLKLLGSRAALQRHMKEVHHRDVVGACACDRCGKTFQNKSNLKIHMLTHSGVKPFRCAEDNCPAAFTTKQCLQFHYKKVHGYGEDNMPSIERCVAYTFDAYSGGTVEDPGRGKVPLFAGTRLGKDADDMDSNQSTQPLGSEMGDDECMGAEGESPQQQPRVRKEALGEGRREKGGRGRGRRPGRPSGAGRVVMGVPSETPEAITPDSTAATLLHEENSGGGMHVKGIVEGDALVVVDSMVPPTIIPEDIMPPHQDADVLPPPPPVIPGLPDGSVECKEDIGSRERTFISPSLYSRYPVPAMLGSMVDSQPPPLTPQPGPLPTEVAPQTPTLEAYNGGQAVLGPPTTMAQYTDHTRVSFPGGKVVSKGSKKWMGDGSVPMRPASEAEMDEEEDEEEEEEEDEEEELEDEEAVKREEVVVVPTDGQVQVTDVYGAFPEDGRFEEAGPEEGFRRPEESNASLLVEAALDAAERDMTGGGGGVAEDDAKPHPEPNTDGYQLTPSPARPNGPDQQRGHLGDDGDHRVLHHPQPSHHHPSSHLQQHHSHHPSHHHLQHHPHHLSLHPQLAHPHVHLPPPASHLHVQGGALMLHHSHHPSHHHTAASSSHHHHPSVHHAGSAGAGLHPDDDDDDDRLGPGSEATSVGTIVERIVNTSLAEDDETDGRDEVVVPHPSVRAMHHLLHPDTYVPEPHGRLPPAGSLPSPRNMTLLGMKAAVKVEEELQHMAAMQQQRTEEEEEGEEEGLDMSYKHATGHYGRTTAGLATHHMQEEDEEGNPGVGAGDPSADDLQDFRVLRSPQVVEGRFEQSSGGLDMSRGSFSFALPSAAAARCFPLYDGSSSAADVARSVDLRRAGLAYTSPPLPPYSQSLDLTPMRTRHSVDLSLPRSLVGSDGVGGPQQSSGGQSPPSPMHRHLCHAPPPVSPHHHVHHHPHGGGVDGIGGCIVGDDGGEGGSGGGLSPPPPGSYQSAGGYLHGPPSYHRQGLAQHPPSPPPSPYHPQARTAPHMPPPPPAASPSPYHHYSGYY
ncbi:uncharacterized protein LOC124164980 [Ischnura elegans]|uniref:uncharacterized protein LOC124164980 n=1 Tax=Ischnura elegans TaxID=197161 RepID=UPI001ED8B673|nr:uncharacterized protein LOC124164980 [Ischnura elegans]